MDTDFTRNNAKGSREDAQAEITPDQICGSLPKGFDPKTYVTRPWKITAYMHDGERFDLGGRTIEVIATPGHTPDAISLIDRANGLLFTGDTYYPAPIWLFRPETDLDAYAASIRRLAALAPQSQVGSGRTQYSGRLAYGTGATGDRFRCGASGKSSCDARFSGQGSLQSGDISFLMRAPAAH